MKKHAITGQCLCKSVELTVENMTEEVAACHCSMCRNWGGRASVNH